MPIDHVSITAADLPASLAFYDAVFTALGSVRVIELVDEEEDGATVEAVGYGTGERADVWIVAGVRATTGVHVALPAGSPRAVEAFHAAAVAHGGRSHHAPRRWTVYRRGTFHAIVIDPDGNLVEAVADEAVTTR